MWNRSWSKFLNNFIFILFKVPQIRNSDANFSFPSVSACKQTIIVYKSHFYYKVLNAVQKMILFDCVWS